MNLRTALSPSYAVEFNNKPANYQILCVGQTFCATILGANDSHHTNPALRSEWEQDLENDNFEAKGGRILWDIDAGQMNCHSYGCFRVGIPGISTDMHIQPLKDKDFKIFTYENLLKDFFTLSKFASIQELDFDLWLSAEEAQDGDLLLYYRDSEVIHTAIVNLRMKKGRRHYVIESKLGNGPVVEASAELTAEMYPKTTKVRLARVKPEGFTK